MLEEAIDFVKTRQGDARLILVGGGSIIAGQSIAGIGEIIRPQYLEVANAVGAAVSLSLPSSISILIPIRLPKSVEQLTRPWYPATRVGKRKLKPQRLLP